MDTPQETSPTLAATPVAPGTLPPTPPHDSSPSLSDIYGSSEPSSPTTMAHETREMLSDLPSRQRAHDADAYREGLSEAKGTYVQEGFDEGYALGASLGVRVGWVIGILRGVVEGLEDKEEVGAMLGDARRELAIESLLGEEWVDAEGVWKWDVDAQREREEGFRGVAACHPVVGAWEGRVRELAGRLGVDLRAVERSLGEVA